LQKPAAGSGTVPVVLNGLLVFCVFLGSSARSASVNGVAPAPLPIEVPTLICAAVGSTPLSSDHFTLAATAGVDAPPGAEAPPGADAPPGDDAPADAELLLLLPPPHAASNALASVSVDSVE
jgi:hypothetical protein